MKNFKNYFNPIINDNRIFTAEDIGAMSQKEFLKNEKAIDYQMNNLTIPRQNDLAGNPDVVYVHAYTKDDGTEVRAHFRSRPDSGLHGTITGAAANSSQPQTLYGGVTYNDYKQSPRSTIDDYSESLENGLVGKINKNSLDIGINILGRIMQQKDAVNFWNMTSVPLGIKNDRYINKNGKLYESINTLDYEYSQYKTKIKEKVKSQFHKEDVPGIIFHEKSTVANAIVNSQELNNFIYNNIEDLKAGEKVTGSLRFNSDRNLHDAFGSIDILSAKLKNDYVEVILLDTYDFNENDSNIFVQMGYSAQKAGLLKSYFTIVKCQYKL